MKHRKHQSKKPEQLIPPANLPVPPRTQYHIYKLMFLLLIIIAVFLGLYFGLKDDDGFLLQPVDDKTTTQPTTPQPTPATSYPDPVKPVVPDTPREATPVSNGIMVVGWVVIGLASLAFLAEIFAIYKFRSSIEEGSIPVAGAFFAVSLALGLGFLIPPLVDDQYKKGAEGSQVFNNTGFILIITGGIFTFFASCILLFALFYGVYRGGSIATKKIQERRKRARSNTPGIGEEDIEDLNPQTKNRRTSLALAPAGSLMDVVLNGPSPLQGVDATPFQRQSSTSRYSGGFDSIPDLKKVPKGEQITHQSSRLNTALKTASRVTGALGDAARELQQGFYEVTDKAKTRATEYVNNANKPKNKDQDIMKQPLLQEQEPFYN